MAPHKTSPNRKGGSAFIVRLAALIAVFCLLASLAIVRDGRFFSHSLTPKQPSAEAQHPAIESLPNGQRVINTTTPGKDITGFNGPVPLLIYISGNKIDSVSALPNEETPKFFLRASALLHSWDGMDIDQAANTKVDAVSGATYSSNAIIGNFKAGVATIEKTGVVSPQTEPWEWTLSYTFALIVALAAGVLPLIIKNKTYRLIQQLLNVGVLGFWTGTFLDYSVFMRVFSNGLPYTLASVLTLVLFIIAFIYPLLGKSGYYCAWVCPFGSLQELIHKIPVPRLHLSPGAVKGMTIFRNTLWCLLIISLWTGLLANWIDYEIFSAFIIESASWIIIIVGIVFCLLSFIIMRPFCHLVCPVGTLLNHSEGRK